MSKKLLTNVFIVVVVVAAISGVLVLKHHDSMEATSPVVMPRTEAVEPEREGIPLNEKLPTLVDLGAGKCIPCKKMAPILDELKKEYEGKLNVVVYDVWKDPEPAKKYAIRLIPTQIFLDSDGGELFRHEGFFSREDLLAKWRELGYLFQPAGE